VFSVTVRDHMMVAHSLRGAVFGPAQRLHGATFVVDATFRCAELDDSGLVVDIGAAAEMLRAVLGELGYRNLDDEPELAGTAAGGADRHAARIPRGLGELRPNDVNVVHVVAPAGIDDPARSSGGNRYDRMLCDHLRGTGWTVEEIATPGTWPHPDGSAPADLAHSLDRLPDGALVLVDGLIASASAAVLVPRSSWCTCRSAATPFRRRRNGPCSRPRGRW
jgi:6-pyruvoyl-tetrahydropterin synthase